ncbi:LIC_10463 family lipoprotein [Leptospira licerasiae]|uniref:Lipoprotein n=1 Tax=Leptospira licerasiae str. MMD4847 TaxID=1049971 RepID=A0ABN0H771_9LEPT|nr:hypothetical protein [Leptospira licerasiae]EIE02783.1 hypothetical protein LEP1GSC185_1827 [Leptospira licerasiae serovar Varillal str. VAR 010]EJZ41269.1 hypothetical protein LEP1GSC178_1093 [Leptospira licerasiae str. MMD4847]TGM90095.1 hypothetical protein EHR05_04630 [Leptospira licerasiae]
MKKKFSICFVFSLFVLVLLYNCREDQRYEPLRFEKVTRPESSAFQAQVDGTILSGSWEYRFRIKQADRVSLIVEVLTDKPDLGVSLFRKGILFDTKIKCGEKISQLTPCKLEINNPEKGDYSLVLKHLSSDPSEVLSYRIFAAVHGPGYASVIWEEEVARR